MFAFSCIILYYCRKIGARWWLHPKKDILFTKGQQGKPQKDQIGTSYKNGFESKIKEYQYLQPTSPAIVIFQIMH